MSAPPIRSLYRKIQEVLDESKHARCNSEDQLAKAIVAKEPLDFTYYRGDGRGRARVIPCSESSVLRIVRMCCDIGLVEPGTGRLTKAGLRATNPKFIDRELRAGLAEALERRGASIGSVETAIKAILEHVTPDRIPTWQGIREQLATDMDKRTFQSLLTLMSQSGGIGYTRKKIYLPKQ